MIIFVTIGAVCTGMMLGGVARCLGAPEWAAAMIAGLAAGGMTWGLCAWIRKEAKHRAMVPERMAEAWRELALYKEETICAALEDLKNADIDCQYCRNGVENGEFDLTECLAQTNCEKCRMNCPCRGCKDKSNWEWRGICEENGGEEE